MSGMIRVGIDVGGTFTHAVAIDSGSMKIVGSVKVPTSHRAKEGVALGIVEALKKLLTESSISAESVGFIAHSTTQATNALLEGDVAPVGIVAMGSGINGAIARRVSSLGKLELAPDKYLNTFHKFIDTGRPVTAEAVKKAVDELVKQGAKAIAVSEAFSVDDSANEAMAVSVVREMGLPATAGHEVSQLYGYKVRTRTAVINASMLPKMIESADMTESSVREAGITAPVMIMRSDGGVMDIDAMRKRPILTMLSGPAAGVAAAMMFLRISDGVFLEVGGTSTDISAISNGRAKIKTAEIGGHRVYMRTLDVRTVGVAGGSLARIRGGKLLDVGPRSAHIAGLVYSAFSDPMAKPKVELIKPMPDDPSDYVMLSDTDNSESRQCVTPTCAANLLKLVPAGNCAAGNDNSVSSALAAVGATIGLSAENAATEMLRLAAKKCIPIVEDLIKDHKLDGELVMLIGGGGGAAAIVPFVAKEMGLRFQIAEHADVISAIGVALALIRETVERQIVNPSDDDILRLRQEAHASVEKMGADPASIEVHIEIDTRTSVVRATACGATSMTKDGAIQEATTPEERKSLAAESMRVAVAEVSLGFEGKFFQIYSTDKSEKRMLGLLSHRLKSIRVLDHTGGIRLQFRNAAYQACKVDELDRTLGELIEQHSEWGDAGKVIPDMVLLAGPKIIDLSGVLDSHQVQALARAEMELVPREAEVVAIARLN
ncbi:MAG: hydantoinase/oxoprolinase family protein [Candidatus Obscuribacterales bacterium]|nr:hydantoinase/oxoprolinase family protein [Candidatus Obscuribacterales bacterium]